MNLELDEQDHAAGVKSATHPTCLVAEPITLVIEGKATRLSLVDAKRLAAGLSEAIERIEGAERQLKGDSPFYNLAVIGTTETGMSLPRSKLGDGTVLFLDPQGGTEMLPALHRQAMDEERSGEVQVITPNGR